MRRLLLLPMAGVLLLGLAGSAQALTITTAITTIAPNTADGITDTTTNYNQNRSSVSVPDAGGTTADVIGGSVNATGRYAAVTAADGGVATTASRSASHAYQITFTVTASALVYYDLTINTSRLGAVTRVDDGTGGATGSIGAVSGTLNAVSNPSLALSGVTLAQGTSAANTVINQSTPTITLTGLSGNQVITLAFSWTSSVSSTCTGFLCSTTGNDEIAVRLGMAGTGGGTPGTTADDYPGVGSRTQADDGHFATANAVIYAVVPEPGTLLLLGAGLAGIAFHGRRQAV